MRKENRVTNWIMSLASGPSMTRTKQLLYTWYYETDFFDLNAVTLQPLVAEPDDQVRFIFSDKFVTDISSLNLTVTGDSPFLQTIDHVPGTRYSNGIWYPTGEDAFTIGAPGIYNFTVTLGDASIDPQMIVKPPCET